MLYHTGEGDSKGVRFESSIGINAPIQRVCALIDRPEGWPRWMPSIRKVVRLSKGPLTVGSHS
ncbi:MAG: SRPBCC family protein [Dehalococcoidia bacterium]|nr:SRPBCC family protein [Dehalococcoidia bacterium]